LWSAVLNVLIAVGTLAAAAAAVYSAMAAQRTATRGLEQARRLAEEDRADARAVAVEDRKASADLAIEDRRAAATVAAEERQIQRDRDFDERKYEREREGLRRELDQRVALAESAWSTFAIASANQSRTEADAARAQLNVRLALYSQSAWPVARVIGRGQYQLPLDLADAAERLYGSRPPHLEAALALEVQHYVAEAQRDLATHNAPPDA
jgi:hypothetical protein